MRPAAKRALTQATQNASDRVVRIGRTWQNESSLGTKRGRQSDAWSRGWETCMER